MIVKECKHGKGVFTNKFFQKGALILQFQGKIYKTQDNPRGFNSVINHFLQIGKETYLGSSEGIDNFINHSCEPNAGLQIGTEVVLIAIGDIQKGEEITFDYSTTMDEDDWEMECSCGSEICRKKIRDFKYLPVELQQKYIDLRMVPQYIIEGQNLWKIL